MTGTADPGPGPTGQDPPRRGLRGLALDLRPLRNRDFRLLWSGELVSETGSNLALVALYIQVFRLTDSTVAVGLIGLAQVVPIVLAAMLGGPIVDRHDRRRVLLWAHACEAVAAAVLLAAARLDDPPLALVYLGAALVAGSASVAQSTRTAMMPRVVGEAELPAATALNQVVWNTCLIAGPALGGIVVARLGLAWAYGIDLATFAAALGTVWFLRPQPPTPVETRDEPEGWRSVMAGFRFLRGRPVLQANFAVDVVAMTFGMPRALFPVLAVTQFGAGPELVGVLFSAVALGALAGALTSGWVGRIHRQGRAVLVAVAVWGAGIAAFGLVGDRVALALGALAVAGGADVVSAVFRNTILQTNTPDALRGRLSGIHILVVTGGPRLGDIEAGVVAALTSPTVSVVSGGLLCIAGVAVLAVAVPSFAQYRVEDAQAA
ncbi:MAG: MFS transporter [Actinomycetota bacterium]